VKTEGKLKSYLKLTANRTANWTEMTDDKSVTNL